MSSRLGAIIRKLLRICISPFCPKSTMPGPRAEIGPLPANGQYLLFFGLIVSDFAQQIKQGDAFGGVEARDGFFADEIGLGIHLL